MSLKDFIFDIFYTPRFCSVCNTVLLYSGFKKIPVFTWLGTSQPIPKDTNICKGCWEKKYSGLDKKYTDAINQHQYVHTYPRSYAGDKGKIQGEIPIQSILFHNRDHALKSLQVIASFNGYNVVYDVEYIKSSGSSGNYIYSMWQAIGKAGKLS